MHTGAAAILIFFLAGASTYSISYRLFESTLSISDREAAVVVDLDALLGRSPSGTNPELQALLSQRVCGSPAVDGYAHVKPECLYSSPTAKWWNTTAPKPEDLDVHLERYADYDGVAVKWGIDHKHETVESCAQACRDHVPKGDGPFGWLPCNAFSFCSEKECWEPDAHKHSKGDCWLKFTEAPAMPEVNMRGKTSKEQLERHPTAPESVQWHSGVLLPHGVDLKNGTWSPRYNW